MTRSIFVTGLATNIANVSQRMIAEDFEMVPVVRSNQTLLGVVTRRDVMEKMSRSQVSALPTFSEQIGQNYPIIMMKSLLLLSPSCWRKMVSLLMESWLKSLTI